MLRSSIAFSESFLTSLLGQLWFGQSKCEVVGGDISGDALHAVTVSQDLQRSSRSPVPHSTFAWESRSTAKYAQSLSSASDRSAPLRQSITKVIEDHFPRQVDSGSRIASVVLPTAASVLRWPNSEPTSDLMKSIRSDLGYSAAPEDSIERCLWPVGNSGRKMIYAVSGGLTSSIARQLTSFGFQHPIVDSRPHALARAIHLDAGQDSRMIIEWSWDDCSLLIASPSESTGWPLPQLCRPLHGYALSSILRLSSERPESLAKTSGQTASWQSFVPLFRAAAEEIQRTLRFAESLAGLDPAGPVLICGPVASISNSAQILSESLGREVRVWRWNGPIHFTRHAAEPSDALFAVSLGAACGAFNRNGAPR